MWAGIICVHDRIQQRLKLTRQTHHDGESSGVFDLDRFPSMVRIERIDWERFLCRTSPAHREGEIMQVKVPAHRPLMP